jgi:hypothetical protein
LYKKGRENERWFLDHFQKKKIVNFMVAETTLILMFCFKNKAKDRVFKEPGNTVLIERNKWRKTRVKDANGLTTKVLLTSSELA